MIPAPDLAREVRQRFELPASAQVLIVSIYDVEYSENCPDRPKPGELRCLSENSEGIPIYMYFDPVPRG